MEMRGRCGFCLYCASRSASEMRSGTTPGKCLAKKGMRSEHLLSRDANSAAGRKSVHVKVRSSEGMAMNMKELAGQMWR